MTDVRVRGVDENVVLELKAQARRKGRTLQMELNDVLTEAARRPRREWAERLTRQHDEFRREFGELPDSTPGIRAWRDGLE